MTGVAVKGRGIVVLAALGALLIAVVFGGCGSSGSNASATDSSSEPLTKAEFVKQAESICQQATKKKDAAVTQALKERAAQAQGPPPAAETAKLVEETVLPPYKQAIDQIGQLRAPQGDEAKVESFVGEFESALQAIEAEPALAAKKNPFAAADEAAEKYGIANCGL